jgi:hypothetical protein
MKRERSLGSSRPDAAAVASLMVLVGTAVAVIGVAVVVANPVDVGKVLLGGVFFLVGAAMALWFSDRSRLANASTRGRASAERRTRRASLQLGPDPEQVVGRQTGARI